MKDNRLYNNRPLAVDGLIVKNGKILLIKRKNEQYKGFWAIPGGHVEIYETVEEAVKREVKEETDMDSISVRLLSVYSNPKRSNTQTVAIAYIVEGSGAPKAGDDAEDFQWFPLTSLPDNLAFDHREIINDYIRSYK